MIQFDKNTDSSDQTILLAKSLSSKFKPGGIYGFIGDLASGKTTFIKGLLSGLDFIGMVNSPTFTLINEYDAKHKVIHIDCYREKNISRWIQLGLYDYFDTRRSRAISTVQMGIARWNRHSRSHNYWAAMDC